MRIKEIIKSQYYASLEMLRQAIEKCPETLWGSAEYTNQFWHVAYHVIFYTHFYLHPSEAEFVPWEKHRDAFCALRLWPESQGIRPWHASSLTFRATTRLIRDLRLPLMISAKSDLSSLDRALGGIDGTVVLTGVGYPCLGEAMALMARRDNVCVETSWLTTIDGVELLCREVGEEKILFGSGYPFQSILSAILMIEIAEISDTAKECILWRNGARIFGLHS